MLSGKNKSVWNKKQHAYEKISQREKKGGKIVYQI